MNSSLIIDNIEIKLNNNKDIINTEVIKKVFNCQVSNDKQPHGPNFYSGKKYTTYNAGPNRGMSRLPRSHGKVRQVPFAVGGRKAHPLKVEKNIKKHINKKELNLAFIETLKLIINKIILLKEEHLKIKKIKEFITVLNISANKKNNLYVKKEYNLDNNISLKNISNIRNIKLITIKDLIKNISSNINNITTYCCYLIRYDDFLYLLNLKKINYFIHK